MFGFTFSIFLEDCRTSSKTEPTPVSVAQNVLIAGHSYASRLRRFMAKTNIQTFELYAGRTKCYFSCKGGATIPKLGRNGLFDKLAEHRLCSLIFEIGTNDLDSTMADAAKLARDLCSVSVALRS